MDDLSRHSVSPNRKGEGSSGLIFVSNDNSVFLKVSENDLFFFFFFFPLPDITVKYENKSPAIILSLRMEILLLFSISCAPLYNSGAGRQKTLMSRRCLGLVYLLVILGKDEFLNADQ